MPRQGAILAWNIRPKSKAFTWGVWPTTAHLFRRIGTVGQLTQAVPRASITFANKALCSSCLCGVLKSIPAPGFVEHLASSCLKTAPIVIFASCATNALLSSVHQPGRSLASPRIANRESSVMHEATPEPGTAAKKKKSLPFKRRTAPLAPSPVKADALTASDEVDIVDELDFFKRSAEFTEGSGTA